MPLALAALTLGLALSAVPDSTALPHAIARRGCTQEDAPALEVYLSRARYDGGRDEPATPYVRLEIAWNAWRAAPGRPLALVPLVRSEAQRAQPLVRAELHEQPGAPVWLRGTVRLRRVTVGRTVVGTYDFQGPAADRRTGRFTATWVDGHGGCG